MKLLLLIAKNLGRNPLRVALTALGTMMLVFVVTQVWSVLSFLDALTAERSRDIKAIVSERWRIPSLMPYAYVETLKDGAARHPGDVRPSDYMAWQFYGGTIDPARQTRDSIVFAVATEADKVGTMMDELELDRLPAAHARMLAAAIAGLKSKRHGMILGQERLAALQKRPGDRFKIYSLNFKGIDLEFEVVGQFPPGRYDNSAVMNDRYLNEAIDAYARRPGGGRHPMADRNLNLVWLKVPDTPQFVRLAGQILASPNYTNPAVKCETASSGIASFLEAFRDLIWGMRWMLSPAALVTLSLVVANSISISVRERRTELAVLKVLGFRPRQILVLVLGEALLVGTLSGFASAAGAWWIINYYFEGIKLFGTMFGSLYIPNDALWWGAAMGGGTALAGSIVPAWSARSVKAAEIFAKVA